MPGWTQVRVYRLAFVQKCVSVWFRWEWSLLRAAADVSASNSHSARSAGEALSFYKGVCAEVVAAYQGTNEDLPRKPERRPIIPFNSVLHGKVHGSESLNWSGALCQAGWIHTDEVLCDSLKWHFLAEMERPSACRLHSALPTCFFCSDFSPALIFDIFCLDYPTTFSLTTTTAMV